MSADYSRPLSVIRLAGAAPSDDLVEPTVLVTADATFANSPGLRVLLGNLRRLPITIHLDLQDATAADALSASCAQIDPNAPILIGRPTASATVHVHLGVRDAEADIFAVPAGHGVHLRRRGEMFPAEIPQASGLGQVFTAAVLTAEAFKDLLDLPHDRAPRTTRLSFCPVTLTDNFAQVGSPPHLSDTALVGGGAIGTAVALILRELSATGDLIVVDPETFDDPNLMTYSLGTVADASSKTPKVGIIEAALPNLSVRTVQGTAVDFLQQLARDEHAWPTLVLGAVDSVEARHQIARLQADMVFDGGTGGRAGTTLSLAEACPSGPCLRCYYPSERPPEPSAEQKLSALTGLQIERIGRGDELLASDLQGLTDQQRALLASHVGKPICGLARDLGLTTPDFRPSIAFSAQQAAALIVGALLRRPTYVAGELLDVEYDALHGPKSDMAEVRSPQPDCACQRDAQLIAAVRQERMDRRP